jgi:iron complex outermembrane receptor protein
MTILAVLVPHLVLAQSSPGTAALKNLSLEELAKVEITTASKQPERAMDIAAAIYVITGEDIRRSGATTLPDALRLAPGVIVNQSDGNRWAVGVRGFADIFSKSVLVLIDGRSVYTPLVGGVHWAIQDVVLADIERIEVVRGPGGSVWGANAVNGVINVITKPAHVTRGLQVTAAAGTTERARVIASMGRRSGVGRSSTPMGRSSIPGTLGNSAFGVIGSPATSTPLPSPATSIAPRWGNAHR